jgi:hypothetical protein
VKPTPGQTEVEGECVAESGTKEGITYSRHTIEPRDSTGFRRRLKG